MAALTNLSDVINRSTGGSSGAPETIFDFKDGRVSGAAAVNTVAGRMTSLWQYESIQGVGFPPTTVAAPTRAIAGAMGQTNPAGGTQKWLLSVRATSSVAGTLILYDRLLHIGSLSATASPHTIGGTLTRNTGGVGNQIWIEIYTQIGTSVVDVTASYTNQAGTSGRTTQSGAGFQNLAGLGGTGLREAQRIIPLYLASDDTGVQAVASVSLSATTGTAGSFGVTVARPLLTIPINAVALGVTQGYVSGFPSVTEIDSGACLAWAWLATTTAPPRLMFSASFIEK